MNEHLITYYGPIYLDLCKRLHGAPSGDHLWSTASTVARSSRLLEPVLSSFIHSFIEPDRPKRLFEIGCGSGIYLRHPAENNAQLTGIAIDMQPQVLEEARTYLAQSGIGDRFDVRVGNILNPPPELAGPFDIITLCNNIYYFPVDQHVPLFKSLYERLRAGGVFALVSIFKCTTVIATNFELVLRSTLGCVPLPAVDDVRRELVGSGFGKVNKTQLYPGESFYGLLAKRSK